MYEQDLVKQMAYDYFQSKNLQTVDFEIGQPYNERSVRVKGATLEMIISDLTKQIYSSFDIDPNQVPHIDLRGNSSPSVIQNKNVSLINNFIY